MVSARRLTSSSRAAWQRLDRLLGPEHPFWVSFRLLAGLHGVLEEWLLPEPGSGVAQLLARLP